MVWNPYTKENEEVTRVEDDGVYYVKQKSNGDAIRFPTKPSEMQIKTRKLAL